MQVAGIQDFRQEGPPGDIGVFQAAASVIVYQFTFSGVTYTVAQRMGVRGWILAVPPNIDASTVIQAAINALATNGGTIYFAQGLYEIYTPLVITGYTNFVGAGRTITRFKAMVVMANLLEFRGDINHNGNVFFKNFYLDGNSKANIGLYIDATATHVANVNIENVQSFNMLDKAFYVHGEKITFLNAQAGAVNYGFYLSGAGGAGITLIDSWAGGNVGLYAVSIIGLNIIGFEGAGNTVGGINLQSSYQVNIIGSNLELNGADYGIRYVTDPTEERGGPVILGNKIGGCGYGIILARAWGGEITGNRFVNIATADIRFEASCSGISVGGNLHTTLGILDFGATKMNYENGVNYIVKNSGTATLLNGQTTIAFNHGLSYTPTAKDFSIIFTELPTNPTTGWMLGTFTSTQATLTANDPGASNLDFSWSAWKTP